ncbi:MAG: DoxX family protein [Bacteroidetes bacterium]|nr:DoxX family protein [Bacteroidota bacterium]
MDFLNKLSPYAHWLLRIGLASVFLYHGSGKFGDLSATAESLGLPLVLAVLVAVGEVGGGLLILIGGASKDWMTRLAGLSFAVIMIGAIFKVHLQHGWSSIGNLGMEFQFTLLMTSLYFLIVGNGNK